MTNDELLLLPVNEANFCVLDVETTGLAPHYNNIIEIGIVKVSNLKIIDTFETLINPARDIPYYITRITGISNDDVFSAPFFEDAADQICDFISTDILTAHNLSFDKSFLKKELLFSDRKEIKNLNLCTRKLAQRAYPALRSKSLSSLCKHFHVRNKNPHRALPDAEVTAKVLIKMLKELIKTNETFPGSQIKTVGDLINFQYMPKAAPENYKLTKKLSEDITSLPHAPGIYYFLNRKKEIIYVGKAKFLNNRIRSYFSPSAPRKAKKIIKQASRIKYEITNSELTAFLMESETIKKINPRHNVQLKQYGNKYFLRISKSEKFPVIEVCNYFDFDGNDYFGLFVTRKKADKVFEIITKTFAVRECNEKEFQKGRACFLAEIERCTAPCENNNEELYNIEIEKIYEFLYGKNQFALNRLLNKMKNYSELEKYEKAASVKSLIDMILSQTHKSSLLSEPVNKANVLFEITEGYQKDYVLMLEGKIYIKQYALKEKDNFEDAIEDFFMNTINLNNIPNDEDLEKMKITLNWIIKNRNKIRIFYLKDFKTKQELYSHLTNYNSQYQIPFKSSFEIKEFVNEIQNTI